MRLTSLLLIAASVTCVPGVSAQSLFNAAGIGTPVEALDGRARALGNLGIGLSGAALMPTDPGAMARIPISTGIMAGQPSWVDYTSDGGGSGHFQGNRFPLLGIAYPILSGMASIQIGSFLDQHFQTTSIQTVDIGAGPLDVTDSFLQDGSVSNLNLGFAKMVGEQVGVGITLGRYAGAVDRTFTRSFGDEATQAATGLGEYVEEGTWSYGGYSLTAGASADVGSFRVATSIQVASSLTATASEETSGADASYSLPIQYRVGATTSPLAGLAVTASLALADWSKTADAIVGSSRAADTNGFGIGMELSRAQVFGKDVPLRFGFRQSGMPFSFDDSTVQERILSGGFGVALNTTNEIVLAGVDFALERGRRSGAGITENFWRATISLLASGF